jgi:hypothetical protein
MDIDSSVLGGGLMNMKETTELRSDQATANTWLLQVGTEVYPVYGNAEAGWSIERVDISESDCVGYRYRSLEELFFALVNFSICEVGET